MGVMAKSFVVPEYPANGSGRVFSFKPAAVDAVVPADKVLLMETIVLQGQTFAALISDTKVEVVHRDGVVESTEAKNATGGGEWFWRWARKPQHVGRIYAFATPLSALLDGLQQEASWRDHFFKVGGTLEQWRTFTPGDAMPNNAPIKPINEKTSSQ